jgi:AraC-like DNA-binding protein
MRFWDKSRQIFHCLCENAPQSVRRLAQQTGLSKSSVYRLTQAIERRNRHPESWFWETADGRQWLTRLVVATLYTFGLKRGVGVDTMSEFFVRLHLKTQVGCSPSALRGVMQALEVVLLETAASWEQDGRVRGEVREIIGAVDETFLERMMLVFMDLATGYLVLEEVADDRTYVTWKGLVDARLKALGTGVLYLVSDRAKALIQLAEHGLECLSMPDFFHVIHEITKSYSLAIGRHLKHAHQELTKAKEALARHQGRPHANHDAPEATAMVATRQAEVQQWEEVQHTYRHHLETLSLTLHPFRIADSMPQTSDQVASRLYAAVEAIAALARRHQLPARHHVMTKVRTQVPALAALVDFWWQGVWQDVEPFSLSPRWRRWVQEGLLPLVYWEHQVAHTRCVRRKAKMVQALEAVRTAFDTHAITQQLAPPVLADWHTWAAERVNVFQRASSAVEGRNGYLSQMQHNQRGLPKQRYKVWTVLHNFDCRAVDGTTPAARFFGWSFPDLFETVLPHIEGLPRSRQRKHAVALSP